MENVIFSNLQICTENKILEKSCVVVRDKKIHAIISPDEIKKFQPAKIVEFPENYFLVPGFIDLHIHGANRSDVMDATQDALQNISDALLREGTTGFLATTMTATPAEIENVLSVVRKFVETQETGAKVLGVHLEGPFLSPKKVGAQRLDKILLPQIELIERWQKISGNLIKMVTLAPELQNSVEFISYLRKQNIIASFGHTDATYAETIAAIDAGCTHATHLFNAMRGIHQREPGPVVAALLSEKVVTELIADGMHLHPAIMELILKIKNKEKIVLVTDAMRAKCLGEGVYDLGGQSVTVKNHAARLADGTLAGSILKMNEALKILLKNTSCDFLDAIKMTSENPARELEIFSQTGSISVSKSADLVVLDEEFCVATTMSDGKVLYKPASITA